MAKHESHPHKGENISAAEWLAKTYGLHFHPDNEPESLPGGGDVEVNENTKGLEEQLLLQKKLQNKELDQRIKHQLKFFKFALWMIGIPVVFASLGFFILVWREEVGDVAYAAFFASVVAEVIGLSYILGNYFFPHPKKNKGDQEDEQPPANH